MEAGDRIATASIEKLADKLLGIRPPNSAVSLTKFDRLFGRKTKTS
jgi:hypothetical protein